MFKWLFGQSGPPKMPDKPKELREESWWRILTLVDKMDSDATDRVALLESVLTRQYQGRNLLSFAVLAHSLMQKANTPELFAACKLLLGNNDKETYIGFRLALIGLGERSFYAAIKNPDTLADLPEGSNLDGRPAWNGMLKTIEAYFDQPLPKNWRPDDKPRSELKEEEVKNRLPRLSAS